MGPSSLNLCETGDPNMLVLLCDQVRFVFPLIVSRDLLSNFITVQSIFVFNPTFYVNNDLRKYNKGVNFLPMKAGSEDPFFFFFFNAHWS